MIELIDFIMQHFYQMLHSTCSLAIIRHFIKIHFVNKGIEFINLPSIFKNNSAISSIPTYFENNPLSIVISTINLFVVVFNYKKISNRT